MSETCQLLAHKGKLDSFKFLKEDLTLFQWTVIGLQICNIVKKMFLHFSVKQQP